MRGANMKLHAQSKVSKSSRKRIVEGRSLLSQWHAKARTKPTSLLENVTIIDTHSDLFDGSGPQGRLVIVQHFDPRPARTFL